MSDIEAQSPEQNIEVSPPSPLERIGREIAPTAIEAGAMLAAAVITKDSPTEERIFLMTVLGSTASMIGLGMKERRGVTNGSFTEVAKTGLISVAAAFSVDNPDMVMPIIENATNAGTAIVEEKSPDILKAVAVTGGLIVGGWAGVKVTSKGYEVASSTVEKGKQAAVQASNNVMNRIADTLQGTVNKLHARADKGNLERGLPVEIGKNDFRNPDLWKTRTIRPARVNISDVTIKKQRDI